MTSLETLDPEALRRHQWARLEALALVAMPANPFLSARWRRAGLAEARDLRGWDDFRRLPLTRKSELVEDQAAHPPFGTTGTPLRWLDTEESWDWWARCWTVVLRAAGLGPGDRVFFPFSFGLFV